MVTYASPCIKFVGVISQSLLIGTEGFKGLMAELGKSLKTEQEGRGCTGR